MFKNLLLLKTIPEFFKPLVLLFIISFFFHKVSFYFIKSSKKNKKNFFNCFYNLLKLFFNDSCHSLNLYYYIKNIKNNYFLILF